MKPIIQHIASAVRLLLLMTAFAVIAVVWGCTICALTSIDWIDDERE